MIITSGVGRKPGQSRLDLAQTNVNIMKSIAAEISKAAPNAIYVIVSNPVDVLTYVFNKVTDIPEGHILGTGTLLDTARLRSRLADYLNVSQQSVHAYVLGEHGDSSFVPWSSARVSNVPLAQFKERVTNPDLIKADPELSGDRELHAHLRRQRSSSARAPRSMPSPSLCATSASASSPMPMPSSPYRR